MSNLRYRIILKDFSIVYLSILNFSTVYGYCEPTFQRRLEQLRYFYPEAIDWELTDDLFN